MPKYEVWKHYPVSSNLPVIHNALVVPTTAQSRASLEDVTVLHRSLMGFRLRNIGAWHWEGVLKNHTFMQKKPARVYATSSTPNESCVYDLKWRYCAGTDIPYDNCAPDIQAVQRWYYSEKFASKAMGAMYMDGFPESLNNTLRNVGKVYGMCGDLMYEVINAWFMAGEIELSAEDWAWINDAQMYDVDPSTFVILK